MFKIFRKKFECPICDYIGPFIDIKPETGLRKHAKCPDCNSLERHRLQYLVFKKIFQELKLSDSRMLHFAPEAHMEKILSTKVGEYYKVDISMHGVDSLVDMCHLPFADTTFQLVYASHVLEHIKNDLQALSEVKRVLAAGGLSILPVPIVATNTIEYAKPNPHESNHVRAPGVDYFDKYKKYFSRVDVYSSESFDDKYQLYIYEDRSRYPSKKFTNRVKMEGERHMDYVPVCFA
jgi:predicted SAM-dependent methyltransferase